MSVTDKVRLYGSVSSTYTPTEAEALLRHTEGCKVFLGNRSREFLERHETSPVLMQHCLDTTPMRYRAFTGPKTDGVSKTSGQICGDLLMQFTSLTAPAASGEYENCLEFGDPINLRGKKKAGNMCACVLECPGIRRLREGRENFSIKHTVYDRGVPERVRSFLSGTWARLASGSAPDGTAGGFAPDDAGGGLPFEWHTSVGCALHDAHNALKWSIGCFDDGKLLQSVFNGVLAVRSIFFVLVKNVSEVVPHIIQVASETTLPSAAGLESLWLALGIEGELLTELVHFRLTVRDGFLFVSEAAFMEQRALERLCNMCLSLWRVPAFCGSRWLTIGASCRRVLCAWLSGFGSAVKYLEKKQLVATYTLSGVKFLDGDCRHFMAVCGLACRVSEAFLQCVMKDNRVPLQQHLLHDLVLEEVHNLNEMSAFVLESLGAIGGVLGPVYHHAVLRSAMKQVAFLEFRVFAEARKWPWCLCAGNIDENLDKLLDCSGSIGHHVPDGIRWLSAQGISRDRLLAGLQLLSQCSWSSYLVERMHASASVTRKYNAELGLNMLLARSFCHMFRSMLPTLTADEKKLVALKKMWHKELARKPQYISGRNIFVAEVVQTMHVKNALNRLGQRAIRSNRVIQTHARHWHALSLDQQNAFHRRALQARSTAEVTRASRLKELQDNIDELLLEANEVHLGSVSMTFSGSSLHVDELSDLQNYCDEMMQAAGVVKQKRMQACSEPAALPDSAIDDVCMESLLDDVVAQNTGAVYAAVCRLRDFLNDAVLGVPVGNDSMLWIKFVFATLRPLTAFFVPLSPVPLQDGCASSGSVKAGQLRTAFGPAGYREIWSYEPGVLESGDVFGDTDPSDIHVFQHCHYGAHCQVKSFGVAIPLSVILQELSEVRSAAEVTGASGPTEERVRKRTKTDDVVLEEHPWMAVFLDVEPGASETTGNASSSRASSSRPSANTDDHDVPEDGTADAAFAALELQRADTLATETTLQDDFKWTLLGGQWQTQRTGRNIYGYRVDCRAGALPFLFANTFQMSRSASFEQNVYGEEGSSLMSELWASRMTWLASQWDSAGRPVDAFPAVTTTFALSAAQVDLGGTLAKRAKKRYDEIVKLLPGRRLV
eukprot:6476270-Amphidinium_carterae.3